MSPTIPGPCSQAGSRHSGYNRCDARTIAFSVISALPFTLYRKIVSPRTPGAAKGLGCSQVQWAAIRALHTTLGLAKSMDGTAALRLGAWQDL